MYYDEHPPPHFHAMYEGMSGVFLLNGDLAKGSLPPRAVKLVKEWVLLHQDEISENWELACNDMPLNWIKPLR